MIIPSPVHLQENPIASIDCAWFTLRITSPTASGQLARGDHRYAEPHRLVARVLTAYLRALEESPCFISPDDSASRQTTVV